MAAAKSKVPAVLFEHLISARQEFFGIAGRSAVLSGSRRCEWLTLFDHECRDQLNRNCAHVDTLVDFARLNMMESPAL